MIVTTTLSVAFEATLDWIEIALAKRQAKRRARRRRGAALPSPAARSFGGEVRRRATT